MRRKVGHVIAMLPIHAERRYFRLGHQLFDLTGSKSVENLFFAVIVIGPADLDGAFDHLDEKIGLLIKVASCHSIPAMLQQLSRLLAPAAHGGAGIFALFPKGQGGQIKKAPIRNRACHDMFKGPQFG